MISVGSFEATVGAANAVEMQPPTTQMHRALWLYYIANRRLAGPEVGLLNAKHVRSWSKSCDKTDVLILSLALHVTSSHAAVSLWYRGPQRATDTADIVWITEEVHSNFLATNLLDESLQRCITVTCQLLSTYSTDRIVGDIERTPKIRLRCRRCNAS